MSLWVEKNKNVEGVKIRKPDERNVVLLYYIFGLNLKVMKCRFLLEREWMDGVWF